MNEEIIRIAREAGFRVGPSRDGPDDVWGVSSSLVRFADLIRADERDRAQRENAYVLAEREACANICEALSVHPEYASDITKLAAQALRARGTP